MPAMRRVAFFSAVVLAAVALPLKPDSVRLAVIGDMGTGKKPQYELAAKMVEYRQKFPVEFVIMLGDNIYDDDGGATGDYESRFERPYKPLLDATVSFYAALGNHDKPNMRFYKPFNMNGQQYYMYKKGHVRFFVLDTNDMIPRQCAWQPSTAWHPGRLTELGSVLDTSSCVLSCPGIDNLRHTATSRCLVASLPCGESGVR
jgi:hypothetical protein